MLQYRKLHCATKQLQSSGSSGCGECMLGSTPCRAATGRRSHHTNTTQHDGAVVSWGTIVLISLRAFTDNCSPCDGAVSSMWCWKSGLSVLRPTITCSNKRASISPHGTFLPTSNQGLSLPTGFVAALQSLFDLTRTDLPPFGARSRPYSGRGMILCGSLRPQQLARHCTHSHRIELRCSWAASIGAPVCLRR